MQIYAALELESKVPLGYIARFEYVSVYTAEFFLYVPECKFALVAYIV